jgi:pyruvate dehydrogenase E1 component alpha subunit
VVSFFGEAATEEGVYHESINFAVLKKLPVVFVCENNLYSVYSPLSVRQPQGRQVSEQARAYGLESYLGDGNDVTEVFELANMAVTKAREGQGPVFLEFSTYRWREHCGPNFDDHLGYRPEGELDAWKKRDPITRFRERLLREGILDDQNLGVMVRELDAEIDDAFKFAQRSPVPSKNLLSAGVYAP